MTAPTQSHSGPDALGLLDPKQALPTQALHMIEASAGTGKTFTLTTLVVRYVLEQHVTMSEVLLVTFTNEAAAELRQRVRERFQVLLRGLSSVGDADESAEAAGDPDPLLEHLQALPDQALMIDRLRAAINDFDQATITTIHSFSQQILKRAGLEHNPNAELRSDLSTIESDIVVDHVAEISLQAELGTNQVIPDAKKVINGLQMARNQPDATIRPGPNAHDRLRTLYAMLDDLDAFDGDLKSVEAERLLDVWATVGSTETLMSTRTKKPPQEKVIEAIAAIESNLASAGAVHHARAELERQLEERGEIGFNDLLTRASQLVGSSARLRSDLQSRFRVMFVDEFQDTDPTQWAMLTHLLTPAAAAPLHLVMIVVGDPKQAIYRFRGGDIKTYLAAKSAAGERLHQLGVNYRSEPKLIDALNTLFEGTEFGSSIGYAPVAAAPKSKNSNPRATPVDLRLVSGDMNADNQRRAIAVDLAGRIIKANNPDGKSPGSGIKYSEMAVLYNGHSHGPEILRALEQRGIPAVITRGESVLDSSAVAHWRSLFWALERPTDSSRAKAAGLTPFLGLQPADLLDEDQIRGLQAKLRGLAGHLESRGVAYVARIVLRDWAGAVHLARRPGGDRDIVDVEHIAELLHIGTNGMGVSATSVRELLDELVFADPDDVDYASDLTKRRLDTETDEDVVRIMSIHASKGLEFEMVCCPTLWSGLPPQNPFQYFDQDGHQVLHFSTKKFDEADKITAENEQLAEASRLAYVALTRARQKLVVWWPRTKTGDEDKRVVSKSGLGHILAQRADHLPGNQINAPATLLAFNTEYPKLFSVSDVAVGAGPEQTELPFPESVPERELDFRTVDRVVDRSSARLSFSSITSAAFPYESRNHQALHDPDVGDDAGSQDENPDEILDPAIERVGTEVPLAALPAGKDPGTKMHTVFENVDFALAHAERRAAIDAEVAELFGTELDDVAHPLVVDGLDQSMVCPLGPALDDITLSGITRADRLDEMQFDLPLKPGASDAATLPKLSELLLQHLPDESPVDAVVREWAAELATPERTVRLGGFLTGSIDLLFRQPAGDGGQHRYVVADYKSNKIARWPEQMTADVYVQDRLVEEMVHGQYLLQALLYLVATHRFLGQRIQDYDPDVHLGPAAYLFVRGMTGPGLGVFTWRPPTSLIVATDELLLGGRP